MRGDEPATESSSAIETVTLLVPTRNEAANIDEFVCRVERAMAGSGLRWDVVFADDSDDSTPEIIAGLADRPSPLRVVHRSPAQRQNSISGALLAALPMAKGEVVVVIDADLQHPPEVLPRLIDPIVEARADVVIGTRYRPGGSPEGLTGFWRRVGSRGAGSLSRVMFPGLWRCTDPASGLFAFRRDLLDGVRLRPLGFKFLVELVVRARPDPIAEVPYVFASRNGGLSKATVRDGIVLLRHLLSLRLRTATLWPARVIVEPSAEITTAVGSGPPVPQDD